MRWGGLGQGGSRRTKVTVLALVLGRALWDRLLGFSILKGTEVEGPVHGRLLSVTETCCPNTSRRAPEDVLLLEIPNLVNISLSYT